METELKDSVLHWGGGKQISDGKNNSLGEDVQPEVFCNASVDEEQNGNGCSSQVKSALVQSRAPRHCPDGDQADLGGSSQLDQQPGTDRELDGSPGTDVETNKESLLSGSFSSFEPCRESLSCEENICTLDSGSIGFAEKEFQEHLLESCLSDFGSSGSSGLVDLSVSCMDRLIGTLDFPQPDSYQQKEPEQDDEIPEDDQCPSVFFVSCVTSSTMNNLPGNPASAVEQPTAGVTEASNENVCRSDQQSQMVLVTRTESPDNDESQLSSHRDFHLDKEKDHGLHNDSHANGLSTNSHKGVFSLSHDNKLHGATEQRDENCEEDVKSSGMCEEECVNNTMHPGVDKLQGMVARQDLKNFKSSDLSLLTAASGGAKSNQLLSKEHEQVLQMLGLSDSVDATANPADSDLVMSSLSQEEDSPAAPPVDKNAQILPSVSHHCEQGTSESDMDPRPSERDAVCMQHGFFLNLEDVEFPPTYDSDSNTSVTSSCDSPPNDLHVQETSRQNACEAAECTAASEVDSVGQTEQMPCSIDKYITKVKDGTMKPDVDAEDSPIKPDVDAKPSPFSSFGDFSMLELPAEVTEGKEQVRTISSICCHEADNADVYGREDPVPQKALFGNNAHKSRENSSVSDSENSDSIFDAENRHWGSGNHMDPDSDPASLMQNNSSYRPVAAPRSKMLGQAASCFSAGLLGSGKPQPKSGLQDQRRATETACSDLSQSSLIKPLLDRASPDHLSSSQNTEVDLFTTGSSSPDMSEHSPDSSKGILHSGYPHKLTGSPFTVTQNTAEISHESPAVPSFGFGQSSFTPQPQQSQSFETDHARVQSLMQEKKHDVYMNPDWSVIIPDNTHAQPCHTPGTPFHPSPQESQFTTQSQSCFALQGKKPQLGPHNSQSSLRQNLHQPQRHRPEEQKWQTAEHIMQNQRQEEREVELKTVVVTGPSLGPEHEELCSLYFESSKRSGGGEIQEDSIRWDEERKCFFITFLDSQAAKSVTSREHTLKKSPVQVELWSPSQQCRYKGGLTMPMSKEASTPSAPAHYKDRVLVSGVPSETSDDLLLNYLECVADVAVEDIIHKEGDSVLVIFKLSEQDFDVREMLSACEENPLSPSVHMTFKEVPLPRAVFVTGLKTSTVDDAVRLYFSNKRRNGGGPVEKIERASDRSAVVYFKNCDDAASVAKKGNHTLDGNKLQVTLGTGSDEEDSPRQHKATRGFPAAGANESSSDDKEGGGWSKDTASVAKKGNHTLDGNKLQVTLGTESDEEDSPRQHKATRGFPAAGANESSSDDKEGGGWSEDTASVAKKGNHTLDGNKLQVTLGTESDEEDSPRQHKATRGFPAAGAYESSSDDKEGGGWSEGPIPCENDCSNCHNHSHRGADLIPHLSHSSSAPQARTTKIKLSEQSLHRVMSDSSLLRKLTSALKSVDGKFCWKQPDVIIITCLNGQPPHDWEHQVGKVVQQFFQEIETAIPTAKSAPQKPDRNNSSSEMHETPMPSLASSHSVTKRLMPATDILEDTIPHLKPCQLKVLRIPTALEKFIKGCPGLEVTVDEVTKTAKVRAPEDMMKKAFSDILAFVTFLREVKIRLSPALVKMYKKEDTKDWIHTTLIGKHELVCHWELCDDLIVLSGQSSDLSRVEKMFRSAFEETKVEIEKKEQCLLKLPAWLSFLDSLQESRAKYPTPVVLPEGCNIIIVDTPSNVSKTCLKLKNFFRENRLEEKTLKIDQNHLKFLKHYCTEEIKEVHKRAKGVGVSVNFNKTGMVAEGPKDNLPGTVREVKELVSRIKEDKMTFKKPGAAKYLTGDKGQEFLQQTGQATECFITTSDDGKMSSTPSVGRVLAEVKLGPDQQLLIVQGDITQCEVDGIVNAANGQLHHGGGVAAAIVEAGGSCIQEESDELIAKQGDLSEGEVVVTRAGSLECSWILHAVGPTWKGGLEEEDQLLKKTVLETLKKAQEMKMKSVAMPAISCGIFRYPIDQATHIILQAIGKFFTEDRRDSWLKTVMLIDMTDKTLHSFLSAGKMLFGKQLQVKDQPKPTTHSSRHQDDHRSEQGASHGSHSDDAHSHRSHPPIKIISGEIAKSRADVIVCTLHPSLDLRKGVLSKSILEEGGETIQQELRQFNERHGPARIGSVVRTSGGNLHCKYLFHLSLPTWRDDHGQKMQSAVKECLEEASRKRARSIAFPTLGTGKLGYPGSQVAAIMFSVISKWLQDHRDSSVKEVQIIVFSKDNETLQDFKAAEGGGGSHTGGRGHGHRDRGGDTALSGGQSSLKIKMGKITVMVKVGDILTEPCDAIVNSSNDDLDLSRGVLSKAILKVGGRGIVAECRDQKEQMADTGVAVTSMESSQLSCGSVIHVSADRFKRDWHRGILTVLRTADAEGIQSVALPALGTGGRGADPQILAQAMQEAVSQFASKARSVKEVRVVVFQKQMLQPYIAAFSASSRGAQGSDSDAETSPHSKQKMWQEVDVYIYSSQESAIKNAREKIYKHMKDVSVSHTEKNSLIANFDSKQVEQLFKLQNKHKVDITLDKKKSAVTVTGIDIDVAKAISDLKSIMLSASKQHHLAAGLPPVRWQYETGKDRFADFDPENTVIIEAAFKKRERSVHITDKRGRQYKIDFKDRKEYCISDNHAPPVAVKRRDLLQERKDEIPLPNHWAPMNGEKVKVVSLKPDSSEYKKVAQHFSGGGQVAVKKIERIQNPSLFQQFKVKKRELEQYNPKGTENEKRLFHGTPSDSIQSIIENGFNRSYCGRHGTALGAGVYFAADSATSRGYAQGGQMFQARVLVGEYTPGNSGMRMAPNKPNSNRPYDSVSNAASNATVFVIFHDSQAYPEYLISF